MQGALLVGTWKPDMVIVDLRMPNMNGVEFCRFLKGDESMEGVKIIVASAYLSPEAKEEVSRLGVDGIPRGPAGAKRPSAKPAGFAKRTEGSPNHRRVSDFFSSLLGRSFQGSYGEPIPLSQVLPDPHIRESRGS